MAAVWEERGRILRWSSITRQCSQLARESRNLREGERDGGREGEREKRERGREGEREKGERGRGGERERGREGGRKILM